MTRSPSLWLLHRHHAANQTLRHLAEDKRINFSGTAMATTLTTSLSTAELCRSWIKAAPAAPLARRQRRALPWKARPPHAGPTAPGSPNRKAKYLSTAGNAVIAAPARKRRSGTPTCCCSFTASHTVASLDELAAAPGCWPSSWSRSPSPSAGSAPAPRPRPRPRSGRRHPPRFLRWQAVFRRRRARPVRPPASPRAPETKSCSP